MKDRLKLLLYGGCGAGCVAGAGMFATHPCLAHAIVFLVSVGAGAAVRFTDGAGAEGNTMYDALQAITEAIDHQKIKDNLDKAKRVARMQGIVHSSWLGAGASRKNLAVRRLTKLIS
jgi:hypothetical protein